MMKNKVVYDGEEDDETREPQRQKCGNFMPHTDTNDRIYNQDNSCTNASRNKNNNKNNNNDNKNGEERRK